jgi:hypothetical protein
MLQINRHKRRTTKTTNITKLKNQATPSTTEFLKDK